MRLFVSTALLAAALTAPMAVAEPITINCPTGKLIMLEANFHDAGAVDTLRDPKMMAVVCQHTEGDSYILDLGWAGGNPRFTTMADVDTFLNELYKYGFSKPTVMAEPES